MHPVRTFVTSTLALLSACASTPPTSNTQGGDTILHYRSAFATAAGTHFVRAIDHSAFAEELRSTRVLWLGDQHRSSRLHGLQSELLDDLQRRGFQLTLVLEAIGTEDDPVVQDFLLGNRSLDELRQTMRQRWPGSWLDDPELDPWYYRSLLTFAKTRKIPVVPLEPTPRGPIASRDEAMARLVRKTAEEQPDRLLVVIVGQAHLLGEGCVIQRTSLPWIAIGGEPTPDLREAAPTERDRLTLLQSDAGLFWFAEICRPPD